VAPCQSISGSSAKSRLSPWTREAPPEGPWRRFRPFSAEAKRSCTDIAVSPVVLCDSVGRTGQRARGRSPRPGGRQASPNGRVVRLIGANILYVRGDAAAPSSGQRPTLRPTPEAFRRKGDRIYCLSAAAELRPRSPARRPAVDGLAPVRRARSTPVSSPHPPTAPAPRRPARSSPSH
jgi:hypothetical protein